MKGAHTLPRRLGGELAPELVDLALGWVLGGPVARRDDDGHLGHDDAARPWVAKDGHGEVWVVRVMRISDRQTDRQSS